MRRLIFDPVHDSFRLSFREFIEREIAPHHDQWERDGRVDKAMFRKAGEMGYLGMAVPEEYGGGGEPDFRFNVVVAEEIQRAMVSGSGMCLTLHNNVCLPYLIAGGSEEQKKRWLPELCDGTSMLAIAMTEPGAGSDLAAMRTSARRRGDTYVVNGTKTFISSGTNCDLLILAAKTDPEAGARGISMFVVDADSPGLTRSQPFSKIGLKSQDTCELSFDGVEVPATSLLGEEGSGFGQLMQKLAQERLGIAIAAVEAGHRCLEITLEYARERTAFGTPIGSFQSNRFALAELTTELDIARSFVDRQIIEHNDGLLSGVDAAKAKWWCTELLKRTVDTCLQLHGGYGYMLETPISRAFLDARVQTIYGGTTQIMKEIIGRSLKL
ncbi:acyl-CoA dehydrogenase family protein [Nocardioides hungaricus]